MKITEKQLLMLFIIAKDSLEMTGYPFSMNRDSRVKLVNEIIQQQSEEFLIEIGGK